MNKKILKRVISILAAALMLTTSFAALADDGIITPWNTTYDFNNSSITWDPSNASAGSIWEGSYVYYNPKSGCPAEIRDGYTDATTRDKVYDSVTGVPGDKYVIFSNKWNTTDNEGNPVIKVNNANSPGTVYFNYAGTNSFSKNNGGLIYGNAHFEFDMRISDITAADYSGSGYVKLYALSSENERIEAVNIPIKHSDSGTSWYIASGQSVNSEEWIHLDIYVDAAKGTYYYKAAPVDPNSEANEKVVGKFTSTEAPVKTLAVGRPLLTMLVIQSTLNATTSIDNMSVTKETFVVDETKTAITTVNDNVNASVTIGNCVYADDTTSFSDAVPTTSPVAILALYNKTDGSLIDVDFKTATYAGHNDTDKFSSEPDYQTVSLSLTKPSVEYEAKVMVWNNMTKMVPYTASYPAPAAE